MAAEQRHAAADCGPRRRSGAPGVAVSTFRHGSAERYEVVIDFSAVPAGTRVELLNASNNNNVDFDHTGKVMAFDVVGDPVDMSDPTWNRDYNGMPLVTSETMSLVPTGREKVGSSAVSVGG